MPAPPEPFGTAGRFAITSSFALSAGYTGYSPSDASSFSFRFVPAVDYFVARNLSLGGFLVMTYDSSTSVLAGSKIDTTTSTVGLGVSLGYNVPLSEVFSWWLRAQLGYSAGHQKSEGVIGTQTIGGTSVPVGASIDEQLLVASLYLPFLIHPVPHFFIGIGPEAFVDIVHEIASQDDRRFHFGASSTLGGWF